MISNLTALCPKRKNTNNSSLLVFLSQAKN
nr:MAG TPA: hypothetical protein [Caudoviricetes sp.]